MVNKFIYFTYLFLSDRFHQQDPLQIIDPNNGFRYHAISSNSNDIKTSSEDTLSPSPGERRKKSFFSVFKNSI